MDEQFRSDVNKLNPEELKKQFYQVMIWYFRDQPTGVYQQVGQIRTQLEELNKNLKAASDSSTRLSGALNFLTGAGVFVGLIVGLTSLFKH